MENFSKSYSSEDFVEQILTGLPPQSLMRFQCVCNLWCNLIKSPSFVAKHLSCSIRASSLPILFKCPVHKDKNNNIKDAKQVDNDNDNVEDQNNDDDNVEADNNDDDNVETLLSSLNFCSTDNDDCLLSTLVQDFRVPLPAPLKPKYYDLTIAGHCDGIICLKLFIGNIILCNPAMKEFKLLPKSFLLLPKDDFDLWSLDHELECYTEHLGFGYDPKGKDFKVVRFVIYDESGYWFGAEVYTINSNCWREIKTEYNAMTSRINWCFDMPLYYNGICYWHVQGYHMAYGEFIISFDMGKELFDEILIPDLPNGCRVVKLAMWKDFISLFTYQEKIGVPQFYDMWVMMDDDRDGEGSWEKHLTIRPVEGDRCPLLFWKSDQLLMVTSDDGHIVLYDIGTHILKCLPIRVMIDVLYCEAVVYVKSIISIKGGNVLEDIHISAFYGSGKFYSSGGRTVDISPFYGNVVMSAR